jgi:hypothetical protein
MNDILKTSSFEISGHWWDPENKEYPVLGDLYYNAEDNNEIKLEIYKPYGQGIDEKYYDFLHGFSKGNYYTLIGLTRYLSHTNLPNNYLKYRYEITCIASGLLEYGQPIESDKFQISSKSIDQYFEGNLMFREIYKEENNIRVFPSAIKSSNDLMLNEATKLVRTWEEVELTDQTHYMKSKNILELNNEGIRNFIDVVEYAFSFFRLIDLLTAQVNDWDSIVLIRKNNEHQLLVGNTRKLSQTARPDEYLIPYEFIKNDFKSIFNTWTDKIMNESCKLLYFEIISLLVETNWFSEVQLAELIDRLLALKELNPKITIKNIKETNEDNNNRLHIKAIISYYCQQYTSINISNNSWDIDKISEYLADLRNTHTHPTKEKKFKDRDYHPRDIMFLLEYIKTIAFAALYEELGIPKNIINKAASYHKPR